MEKTSMQATISQNYKDPNFRIDFIGVGAAKSGTTWLTDNLNEHPDIFVSPTKEITYFNETLARLPGVENPAFSKDLDWYHDYFETSATAQIKGEFSVQYMMIDQTAQHIHKYHPNVKILAILRYPPKQVFSWYQYSIQRGVITYKTLEEAIDKRPDMFASSFYYKQLKPYFELFPRENIKVLFFEDIKKDPQAFFKEALDFLGVKEFYPESLTKRSNTTKALRVKWLTNFIQEGRHFITKHKLEFLIPMLRTVGIVQLGTFIRDKVNVKKVQKNEKAHLSSEMEQKLKDYYRADVTKLEALLEVDLSHWK